jgi:hypothetical protein
MQSTTARTALDAIQTKTDFCSLCMGDDETLLLAPCGHGLCKLCWQGYIATAIVDGSTTKVRQGHEDLLDLAQLQCPGCKEEDLYQGPSPAPFLPLSFLQLICPPATSHSFSQRICEQLASKFLRSNLPGALCSCGSGIVGMLQEDEFICGCCARLSTIGDLKRSGAASDSFIPHPWSSCAAATNWHALSTSGSVERSGQSSIQNVLK